MTWAEDDVVMLSKRDARGVTAMYDYDAEGNVRSETVDGKSSKYTYEMQSSAPFSKSRMTSKEDRNGNRFGFVLDMRDARRRARPSRQGVLWTCRL
ncbi:hypothetical protein PEC18_36185 [Paucibacter sp. O1-1]|nr:hypothetical protein [Paucibacter sp. O1-1]MDA3831093.1 hypothetical protein [Paucibacter sp. O1-1]